RGQAAHPYSLPPRPGVSGRPAAWPAGGGLHSKFGGTTLRFVTLERLGYPEPGLIAEGRVIGLRGAGFKDMISIAAGGADAIDRVFRWMNNPPGGEQIEP